MMAAFHATGAVYESRKRRWLFRTPRHHAESTRSPTPGKRIRTRRIVRSRFAPAKPGAIASISQRRAHTPPRVRSAVARASSAADRARDPRRLLVVLLGEQPRVDRDEGRRQHALAEEVLQEVRDAERRREGVGRVGQSEVVREDALAHEPRDATEQDAGRDQRREPTTIPPSRRLSHAPRRPRYPGTVPAARHHYTVAPWGHKLARATWRTHAAMYASRGAHACMHCAAAHLPCTTRGS